MTETGRGERERRGEGRSGGGRGEGMTMSFSQTGAQCGRTRRVLPSELCPTHQQVPHS